MALSRGWAMRVRAAEYGKFAEVGANTHQKHINVRVSDGGRVASCHFNVDDAKLMRRYLSRAIRELSPKAPS